MQIQFNDEPMQCAEGQTVSGLLTELNQLKPGAALALNQQILPREQWQQQIVQEGDQILLGGDSQYVSLCRKHWRQGELGPYKELNL